MSLLLHIIVTYIMENIITKLQKLYSPPRYPRVGNKSHALFVKKPLCTGDLLPARKIFIERPVFVIILMHRFQPQEILLLQELLLLQAVILFKENNHLLKLHKQHLKIVHRLKNVLRKLMVLLLMKQILLKLQGLLTI